MAMTARDPHGLNWLTMAGRPLLLDGPQTRPLNCENLHAFCPAWGFFWAVRVVLSSKKVELILFFIVQVE